MSGDYCCNEQKRSVKCCSGKLLPPLPKSVVFETIDHEKGRLFNQTSQLWSSILLQNGNTANVNLLLIIFATLPLPPQPLPLRQDHFKQIPYLRSMVSTCSGDSNGPYSYSQYWTGTSLQWRLMRGNLFKCK